jgi:hypothetical protein
MIKCTHRHWGSLGVQTCSSVASQFLMDVEDNNYPWAFCRLHRLAPLVIKGMIILTEDEYLVLQVQQS